MRWMWWWLIGLVGLVSCGSPGAVAPPPTWEPGILIEATPSPDLPALRAYQQALAESLRRDPPVLNLLDLDPEGQAVVAALLADDRVRPLVRDVSGAPLRNEVFLVRRAAPSDLTDAEVAGCVTPITCWRVELYHAALNATTLGVVARRGGESAVVRVETLAMQPTDVPRHLADLAVALARADPTVQAALRDTPDAPPPVMANIKTTLNATRCERAQHLCVAPTFHAGGQTALWAIVDLTDLRIVGIQSTPLGSSGPPVVTMRLVEDAVITAQACDRDTLATAGDWTWRSRLTASDGLEIRDLGYRGQVVAMSIKLVDWHVSYSGEQQFGYSDAIGCPTFSAAAVPAFTLPTVTTDAAGVTTLLADFRHPAWPHPCAYRYQQALVMAPDGTWTVQAISLGRGCGTEGTYRPVLRIALAGTLASAPLVAGTPAPTEAWFAQADQTGSDWLSLTLAGQPWTLLPGDGDRAFLYLTRTNPSEGEVDLPTIGPCCHTDAQQGPEAFVTDEALIGGALTLWYVPQMVNNGTPGQERCWADAVPDANGVYAPRAWPCVAGPRFQRGTP